MLAGYTQFLLRIADILVILRNTLLILRKTCCSHLENLVFIELLRRGYVPGRSLFYYHTRYDDKEVDFVCRAGTKVTEIIQVCYEISTIGTLTRETAALDRASGELGCDSLKIIVWNEPSVTVDSRYNVIRFSDWALEHITETH